MITTRLDCVVIGYHDRSFAVAWADAEAFTPFSGKRWALMGESVERGGERQSYRELYNDWWAAQTGQPSAWHVAQMPNLGVCYLTSFLRQRQYAVEFVNFFTEEQDRLIALLQDRPRAVAITTTLYTDSAPIAEIIQVVRRHCPDTCIIVGGPRLYNLCRAYEERPAMLAAVLDDLGADVYVHDSQGETTLARVLEALRDSATPDLRRIPNLLLPTGTGLTYTPREPEDNNLDANTIAWNTFDRDFLAPIVTLRTARSCAYKCAFCTYPAMAGALNLMSLDVVERELRQLADAGVTHLLFIDDTFNIPLPRFKQLCRLMIDRGFGFRWTSYFRCSNADDETFDLMRRSGCHTVFLGIESGDQTILNNMNKAVRIDRYRYGLARLHDQGILTFASFIIGFPGETRETALRTQAFIEETTPTFYRVLPYYHYRATPIHQQAEAYGIRGEGYRWTHKTMAWPEAYDLMAQIYRHITTSWVLPLHGFDFWGVASLVAAGRSMEEITRFLAYAQPLLMQSVRAPGDE